MIKRTTKFACAAFTAALLGTAAPASAKQIPFDQASIAQLEAAMAAGTLSAKKMMEMCLALLKAYDRDGPKLHAIITLNPKAMEQAKALDAERKAGKVRGALHGIP